MFKLYFQSFNYFKLSNSNKLYQTRYDPTTLINHFFFICLLGLCCYNVLKYICLF